jgi:hypothetical protein
MPVPIDAPIAGRTVRPHMATKKHEIVECVPNSGIHPVFLKNIDLMFTRLKKNLIGRGYKKCPVFHSRFINGNISHQFIPVSVGINVFGTY